MRDKDEIKKEYDEYYRKNNQKWAGNSGDIRDRLSYEAIARFKTNPVEILDIGCGNGHTLKHLQKRFPEAKMYGLDLSGEAIENCKKNLPDAIFYEDFLEDLSTKKKFEVIVLLGVLEHFEDIQEGLKKVKSLLKKDGVVYVEVPHNLVYSKGSHDFRRLKTGSHQVEWHLEKSEWEKHFVEAGFEIKKYIRNAQPQWEFTWVLA